MIIFFPFTENPNIRLLFQHSVVGVLVVGVLFDNGIGLGDCS